MKNSSRPGYVPVYTGGMDKPRQPKKRGRPPVEGSAGRTPVTQFRLAPDTLADLEYLVSRYALPSKAAVVRFLARRAAQEERRKEK